MNKRIVIVAILAAFRLALPAAAAAPTISLGNGVLEVPAGQTAPLLVSVADVRDLYGVEIHLRFDPTVVQVTDADPNTDGVQIVLGDFLSADFVAQNRADNQAGAIDYAVTQLSPSEPKSGSGTLMTIRFQGVDAGRTSQLVVTDQILTTRDGERMAVTVVSGEIRVASTATRAVTNTPVPAPSVATASALPSATPGQAPVAPSATPVEPSVRATATRPPQILVTEAPAAAAETSLPGSTPAVIQPTPALVAKPPADSTGKAILEPDVSEKPDAGQQQQDQPKRSAFSGLLIGAGVLIGLAAASAAVGLWLLSRRRRA